MSIEEYTLEEVSQIEAMKADDASSSIQASEEVPHESVSDPVETAKEPEKDSQQDATQKTVPLAALHEEREARKELKRQLEEQNRRFEERFAAFQNALKPQEDTQPKGIPDPESDPLGALKAMKEKQEAFDAFARQNEETQRYQAEEQQVMTRAIDLEREFIKDTPDYNEASQHLIMSRRNELAAFGMPPEQIAAQIKQETLSLAQMAIQQGKNPAQLAYEFAKLRGYAPKAATAPVATAAETLAKVAQGQKLGASLATASGGQASKTGIEALLSMSDDEFYAKTKNGGLRKIIG